MLLSKVPHSITSAYKFSLDGPLGVEPLTLPGLVARTVQNLKVFSYVVVLLQLKLYYVIVLFKQSKLNDYRKLYQMRTTRCHFLLSFLSFSILTFIFSSASSSSPLSTLQVLSSLFFIPVPSAALSGNKPVNLY